MQNLMPNFFRSSWSVRLSVSRVFCMATCLCMILTGCMDEQPKMAPADHTDGLGRANPGYTQYLEKQSLLGNAQKFSSIVSGSELNWRNENASPSPDLLLRQGSVWLLINPNLALYNSRSAPITQFQSNNFWSALQKLGAQGVYFNATAGSGGIWSNSRDAKLGGGDDMTQYTMPIALGREEDYVDLQRKAGKSKVMLGGDLPPAATGIGPDFFLATRDFRNFSSIYMLAEVPQEAWVNLPPLANDWEFAELSLKQQELLAKYGIIPPAMVQDFLPFMRKGGWAATAEIRGADGNLRRWVYRYYGNSSRPVLNWDDPASSARQIFNAGAVYQTGLMGNVMTGMSLEPFIGLDPAPASPLSAVIPAYAEREETSKRVAALEHDRKELAEQALTLSRKLNARLQEEAPATGQGDLSKEELDINQIKQQVEDLQLLQSSLERALAEARAQLKQNEENLWRMQNVVAAEHVTRSGTYAMQQEANSALSRQVRKYGGVSWLKDASSLNILKNSLERGTDFITDAVSSPAAEHALLSGDAELLRFMVDDAIKANIDFKRLIHKTVDQNGIDYSLSHLRYLSIPEVSDEKLRSKAIRLYCKTLEGLKKHGHSGHKTMASNAVKPARGTGSALSLSSLVVKVEQHLTAQGYQQPPPVTQPVQPTAQAEILLASREGETVTDASQPVLLAAAGTKASVKTGSTKKQAASNKNTAAKSQNKPKATPQSKTPSTGNNTQNKTTSGSATNSNNSSAGLNTPLLSPYMADLVPGYYSTANESESSGSSAIRAAQDAFPFENDTFYTTSLGLATLAMGMPEPATLTAAKAAEAQAGHFLLTFYKAMQPGIVMISAQDLVGLLPLNSRKMAANADTWQASDATLAGFPLLIAGEKATVTAQGIAAGTSAYGPIDLQTYNPASFVNGLASLLKVRSQLQVSESTLRARIATTGEGSICLALELPQTGSYALVFSNFSRNEVREHVDTKAHAALAAALKKGNARIFYGNATDLNTNDTRAHITLPGWGYGVVTFGVEVMPEVASDKK